MDEENFLIAVEAGPAGSVKFRDGQEVIEWILREQEFWAWTSAPSQKYQGCQFNPAPQHTIGSIGNAVGLAQQLASSPTHANAPHNRSSLEQQIRNYISTGLSSVQPRARFIAGLAERHGANIGFGALIAALGAKPQQDRRYLPTGDDGFDLVKGSVAVALFDLGLSPDTATAVTEASAQLVTEYKAALDKAEKRAVDRLAELKAEQVGIAGSSAKSIADVAAATAEGKAETKAAIEELKTTEKAYKEQMKLAAPVSYWTKKAKQHENHTRSRRNWLVVVSIAWAMILGFGLYELADRGLKVAEKKDINLFAPLLYLGLGLVLSTSAMWCVRIFLRLFLSEHHLSIDAHERATMAETYLALTNEGKIEPSDRALVLAPLFRPTADGIVKDDGAPDFSLAGQLSKMAQPGK